ncbi:PKD domain-containing protein [Ammonicoccus fulvus]|uniref:PKD domain-containing protein n=1 Tax=Ammonicoccus fulvus TaxID=3138240 RepID=A0ABZ3FS42_9ACTN
MALPLALTGPSGTAHAALPTGFQIKNYPTGLSSPYDLVDFAYTPDNGFFSLGKRGRVSWTSPTGTPRTIFQFNDLTTENDLGAITIVLGHNYGAAGVTPSVWIVRVRNVGAPLGGPYGENILSEFPVTLNAAGEPTGLGPERRVLWFPNRFNTHSMDDVVVDPRDGTLWVSVGDSADFTRMDPRALDAQRRDSPYGRIMHMDRTGAGIAATNPDFDPANSHAWYSKTFAKGLRNPFRMSLHPTLPNTLLLGDVGWNTTEEQNVVTRGGNYGWPCWEGNDPTPEYRDLAECRGVPNANRPILTYPRSAGMGSSSVGGLIYQGPGATGGGYPSSYVGSYFFADYSGQKIFNMRLNDTATAVTTAPAAAGFANNDGGDASRRVGVPVSLKYAPNGDIAYADLSTNQVRRITYASGNHAPSIVTAQYETIDPATLRVRFSATATDLDADLLTYRWDFGDGTSSTLQNPEKTYQTNGTFTARVTVSDGTASTSETVTVRPGNRTPVLTLTTPPDSRTYAVGEEVRVTATATDEDEPGVSLPIKWTSILYHCSGEFYCHRHPGAETTGNTFSELFTNHGDDTTLEIRAETTDAAGVTVYKTWNAKPKLRALTVTNNAGAPISINGTLGGTRQVTVGSDAGISVPATYNGATFQRWSDGVTSNSRTLRMPDADTALQARYSSAIMDRYNATPALRTTLGAAVGPEVEIPGVGRQQIFERGHMYSSETAGVHEVHGAILATYLAQGGAARLGVPTSDERDTPGGAGKMNTFAGTPANPNPVIYWKPTTGAQLVMGSIQAQYATTGTTAGPHGFPRNSEGPTPDRRALYNDFENGGIYWSGATGAQSVYGAIYGTWGRYGWEGGHLRLPTTSEMGTPNGRARYNHFEGGSIYFSPATGAREIRGSIRAKWAGLGWETSVLRLPTTDELGTPDRVGRFNHFEGGSIYWSPGTGAWEVHGLIRDEWARRGWERSSLGYPTSDEFAVPGGRRSNFQRGYIEWVNGRINVVVR